MAIVLYRVDERLIHGQVVVGWGTRLHPDRIVVVDDDLANSPWEQELYTLGLPTELTAEFDDVEHAREQLAAWRTGKERVIVLTRDIRTMHRLADNATLKGEEVILGGIHYAAGRTAVLPYLYLSEEERQEMAALSAEGVTITALDLPGGKRVDLSHLLG